MTENYYNILGISDKSTQDEIKKAYRGLQLKYHPDRNPGNNNEMIQKINEAYEILGDEQKKREYDMMKNNPFTRMGSYCGGGGEMEVDLDDIFSMFFKGGNIFSGMPPGMQPGMPGMQPGMPPGSKIHIFNGGPMGIQQAFSKPIPIIKSLSINMEQVFNGGTLPLEIDRWIIENDKKVFEKETIYVVVPPGIDENEIIILRDKGNIINEECKGDIKINILVQNNTPFKRSGLDLIFEKKISLKESLCGFSFELNHINEKSYTLNNNKGNIVPHGYNKIYPGMGLKRGEHKGNMIIIFNVDFPEKLSDEQIEKLSVIF